MNRKGVAMESTRYNYVYPYEVKIRKKIQQAIEKKEKKMTLEERQLLREIGEANKEMIVIYNHFDYATEPDLIEYYIYQYKAAQIKYGYLLKCMKELYYGKSG